MFYTLLTSLFVYIHPKYEFSITYSFFFFDDTSLLFFFLNVLLIHNIVRNNRNVACEKNKIHTCNLPSSLFDLGKYSSIPLKQLQVLKLSVVE